MPAAKIVVGMRRGSQVGSLWVAMLVSEFCPSHESASYRGAGSQQAWRAQQCDSLSLVCMLLTATVGTRIYVLRETESKGSIWITESYDSHIQSLVPTGR